MIPAVLTKSKKCKITD